MYGQTAWNCPDWVPAKTLRYLAHTEAGRSIRDLAREAGCHASTVLRQVRRVESRRDDPLFDKALLTLAQSFVLPQPCSARPAQAKEADLMNANRSSSADKLPIDTKMLEREGCRVLRRLCETGAVLAVGDKMDKAVVVRDGTTKTAVVESGVAQAMVVKDWITCTQQGRISRYVITAAGRAALARMLSECSEDGSASKAQGFAESATPFADQHREWGSKHVVDPDIKTRRRQRFNLGESPLTLLARRRDRDGKPFLSDELVRAGERLREDFEMAQMGPRVAQNWDRFLTGGARGGFAPDSGVGHGPAGARDRVSRALADLGPGLSDVVLRCCCFLEGLELAEKRMGWSARSGKIVLRIALQRLHRHYQTPEAPQQLMG